MTQSLAITPGELAGIGPDVLIQTIQHGYSVELVAYADPDALLARASLLNLPLRLRPPGNRPLAAGELAICPITAPYKSDPGTPNPDNSAYLLKCLDAAVIDCRSGARKALVTGPLQKSSINQSGITFTGHTEYLAAITNTAQVVMMLASQKLRVALATTHLPLQQVAGAVTQNLLSSVIEILLNDLEQKFLISDPTILVAGLNPHAGESGHLGKEEIEVITPVLENFRRASRKVVGPLPADTLFSSANIAIASAFLAMYHDQGLPVLKALSFGEAANITLGLPIIRTSVDHGTALSLAGTGKASTGSFMTALHYARTMGDQHG